MSNKPSTPPDSPITRLTLPAVWWKAQISKLLLAVAPLCQALNAFIVFPVGLTLLRTILCLTQSIEGRSDIQQPSLAMS